jgi:hypothetical protein
MTNKTTTPTNISTRRDILDLRISLHSAALQ